MRPVVIGIEVDMWIRNAWYVAAFSKELPSGLLSRTILGVKVVFYRRQDGAVTALEDKCSHRRLPLSFGYQQGDNLVCGYHGLVFAPDGKCVAIPGQQRIPPAACVRTFAVEEANGLIWIWMGEAQSADLSLLPDVSRMGDPEWVPSEGYCHLEADYRLLVDNLLDLSHVAFVHGRTIGNTAVAESPIKVSQEGTVVSVHRDVVGAMAPPFYQHLGEFQKPIHRWHTVNYYAPAACIIEIGCEALEEGDGQGRIEGCVMHLMTPETETTTHYFWAFVRHFRQQDLALTEYIKRAITTTHGEDKVVVELQHANLTPEQRDNPIDVAIIVDGGPVRARRVLAEMIEADARTPVAEPRGVQPCSHA